MVTYFLRTPPEELTAKINVVQTYSFCPYECTLKRNFFGQMQPIDEDIFTSWNPFSAELSILSNDKSLGD